MINNIEMKKKAGQMVVCSGLMEKRGHFRKNWLVRLFVLSDSAIDYYKKKHSRDAWNVNSNLKKRGSVLIENIISVKASEWKNRVWCITLSALHSKSNKAVDYIMDSGSEDEQHKWIKHICGVIRRKAESSSKSIGLRVYEKLVGIEASLKANQESFKISESSVSDIARTLSSNFPVLVRLLIEMKNASSEAELVYTLDQVAMEVSAGAACDQIKQTIMAAAENKLSKSPEVWTAAVKSVYGSVMKALQSQGPLLPLPKMSKESELYSQLSLGSNYEADLIAEPAFEKSYKLGRILGSGASSVVRVCSHLRNQKQYAVKCISKKNLSPEECLALQQEVHIMRSLEHKNLVPLIDYFDEEQNFYIVTPLCTGGALFDLLVKRECYSEEDARALIKKLASALDYLHSKHICHRDIKLENILLGSSAPNAEVMIADFGFAKSTMGGYHQGTACGTVGYIAPEIINGQPYGIEVDCWSLGVILYILLCGYPPFSGKNHAAILKLVSVAKYDFNSSYWDDVSHEAKDLVRGLLNSDPNSRLSAKQVLQHPWTIGNITSSQ